MKPEEPMDDVTRIDQIESLTIGCLRYGAESPESIKSPIDNFIAPALECGKCDTDHEQFECVIPVCVSHAVQSA